MANKLSHFIVTCSIPFLLLSSATNAQEADTSKNKNLFEISFGQSLLFFSENQLIDLRNKEAIVVPTSSIFFFVEFRPEKKIRIPFFFNVPTASKQFVVNNQIVNERASVAFGSGLVVNCLHTKINAKSKLEFEIGPQASFFFTTNNELRFAPVIAGRIMLRRGEDFIMYLGTSFSFGTNTWGLLYGTGTIF